MTANQSATTSKQESHRYTGKERDRELSSQWDYFGARYYIPGLKLFSSVDPQRSNTPGIGAYVYCADNPLKYTDPDGEFIGAFLAGIAGAIAYILSTPDVVQAPRFEGDYVVPSTGDKVIQQIIGCGAALGASAFVRSLVDGLGPTAAADATSVNSGASIEEVGGGARAAGETAERSAGRSAAGEGAGSSASRTSQIDRAAFRAEREAFWKAEAKNNPSAYSEDNLARMAEGKAPLGKDGHSLELHHVDRTPEGGVEPMSRTEHRLGDNYKKNHP